jgi:CHASE2 domain-containing sensor protein
MVIQIDMTPDGQFRSPEPPERKPPSPLSRMILRIVLLVGALATAGALAALALWVALTLIPIALGAGALVWGILKFQAWRRR